MGGKKRKRIVMSGFDKDYLSKLDSYNSELSVDGRKYYLKHLQSTAGKKSVVWKVVDKNNNPFALKLATYEDYVDRSFDEELIKASRINGYPQFARIEGGELKLFQFGNKKIKCVAFLEEWVEGICLSDIEPDRVTIPFILSFLEKFCDVLSILKTLKLRHDDLHTGNVMIVKQKAGYLKESLELKIIDLGSLKSFYAELKPIKKGIDDTGNFALQLKFLLNKLHFTNSKERRILSSKENLFVEDAKKIMSRMVDGDKGRALNKPFLINQEFQNLNSRIFGIPPRSPLKLGDPFDYISAEQISDDKLLINLFAESCPWVADITNPNPILLTGPRGCGKSMLFRRFSLKALLSANDKLIDDIPIAGFYISCSAELSNRFNIISTKNQATALKEEIVHYFNLTLLKEIISTLKIISERQDSLSRFGIDDYIQSQVFNHIVGILRITNERRLSLQGVKPFTLLLELVKFELTQTYSAIVKRNKIKDYTTYSFISEVTKNLNESIPYFKGRKIAFLIDDYSVHRIPEHVQPLLNLIIWDRQSSHIFKVSSEKYGTVRYMFNNTSADLSREYTEIDIGRSYINLSESSKILKTFSSELLNHRLSLAEYKGTADSLIGDSEYLEGSLGKQLYSGKSANEAYHGLDTISQVCSGDISTLLEIYRTIFREDDVKQNRTDRIPKPKQHSAITAASRNFLDLTKTFHPCGPEMHRLVQHFGILAKRILKEGKLQWDAKSQKAIPNETTRIEIEESEFPETLSPELDKLYKELIRRAIFIELEPSRGRHTLGITNRLQLRRIYCPSFGVSLIKNNPIKWSQSEFKAFLNDPETKCKTEFETRWAQSTGRKTKKDIPPEDSQQDLFKNGIS